MFIAFIIAKNKKTRNNPNAHQLENDKWYIIIQFISVAQSCPTLCDPMDPLAACQASLSITNSWSLLKVMSIMSVMPSNYLILCCPRNTTTKNLKKTDNRNFQVFRMYMIIKTFSQKKLVHKAL